MDPRAYAEAAMRTEADQSAILERLTRLGEKAMRLDNAARGLTDECGEVSACVKRFIEYGQPLDRLNLLEEVGDCLWRLVQVCKAADLSLEEAMEANLRKLSIRFPDVYKDHNAKDDNRDLDSEKRALEGK